MKKHSADNERIKRKYCAFLKEAKRYSEPTVDAAAKALNRFEVYTNYRDFTLSRQLGLKRILPSRKGSSQGRD